MKGLLLIVLVSTFLVNPSLKKVRIDYVKAVNSKEITIQLHNELSSISKSSNKTLVAYKGAVLTLMARFSKSTKDKKTYFKEGAGLIEFAISEKPKDIELRVIRLGVQENTPKVMGYRKNKEEDKQFILAHYKSISSKEIKSFVKGFVLQSKSFSEEEKIVFN